MGKIFIRKSNDDGIEKKFNPNCPPSKDGMPQHSHPGRYDCHPLDVKHRKGSMGDRVHRKKGWTAHDDEEGEAKPKKDEPKTNSPYPNHKEMEFDSNMWKKYKESIEEGHLSTSHSVKHPPKSKIVPPNSLDSYIEIMKLQLPPDGKPKTSLHGDTLNRIGVMEGIRDRIYGPDGFVSKYDNDVLDARDYNQLKQDLLKLANHTDTMINIISRVAYGKGDPDGRILAKLKETGIDRSSLVEAHNNVKSCHDYLIKADMTTEITKSTEFNDMITAPPEEAYSKMEEHRDKVVDLLGGYDVTGSSDLVANRVRFRQRMHPLDFMEAYNRASPEDKANMKDAHNYAKGLWHFERSKWDLLKTGDKVPVDNTGLSFEWEALDNPNEDMPRIIKEYGFEIEKQNNTGKPLKKDWDFLPKAVLLEAVNGLKESLQYNNTEKPPKVFLVGGSSKRVIGQQYGNVIELKYNNGRYKDKNSIYESMFEGGEEYKSGWHSAIHPLTTMRHETGHYDYRMKLRENGKEMSDVKRSGLTGVTVKPSDDTNQRFITETKHTGPRGRTSENYLSRYGNTMNTEFHAELYTALLDGNKYPASVIDTMRKMPHVVIPKSTDPQLKDDKGGDVIW